LRRMNLLLAALICAVLMILSAVAWVEAAEAWRMPRSEAQSKANEVVRYRCGNLLWSCMAAVRPLIYRCGNHSWCWSGTYIYESLRAVPNAGRSCSHTGRFYHRTLAVNVKAC
jgi:hypothetical protein